MSKETRFAWAVIVLSLLYTVVFHLFVFDTFFGWPLVLMTWLVLLTLLVFRTLQDTPHNTWALVFLGPVLLINVAELLYANEVLRVFGFFLSLGSLSFLSFWLLSPKVDWKAVKSFWSPSWFLDTFAPVHMKGPMSKLSLSSGSRQGLIGIAIAIPFALVFLALFLSADPLIGKVVVTFFDISNPIDLFFRIVIDVFIAYYLTRFLWLAVTRMMHGRMPRWNDYPVTETTTAYTAFLAVLNLLFLAFIGFQFVYFFGGQAIVESYGLTYADYARQGFFQLFTVSVFAFLILYAIKWKTRMRSVGLRLLSVGLVVESWIVIASALKRLSLYIDAYGLTDLRYWAFAGLIVAAVGLLVLVIWIIAKGSFSSLSKILTIGSLYLFSGLLLVNHEALIVNWNANRAAAELVAPDYLYPTTLSTDAMPAYVAWLNREDGSREIACDAFQWQLSSLMFTSFKGDKDRFFNEQYVAYRDLTEDRVPLLGVPLLAMEFEYARETPPYQVYNYITLPPGGATCQLRDWKNALKIFGAQNQEDKLKDPRVWTWSDQAALSALKTL